MRSLSRTLKKELTPDLAGHVIDVDLDTAQAACSYGILCLFHIEILEALGIFCPQSRPVFAPWKLIVPSPSPSS